MSIKYAKESSVVDSVLIFSFVVATKFFFPFRNYYEDEEQPANPTIISFAFLSLSKQNNIIIIFVYFFFIHPV